MPEKQGILGKVLFSFLPPAKPLTPDPGQPTPLAVHLPDLRDHEALLLSVWFVWTDPPVSPPCDVTGAAV